MLSFGDGKSLILLIRVTETRRYVDKTRLENTFFPKRWSSVWPPAIEKRHMAIDRSDVFSTGKALENDGRDNACATLVFYLTAASWLGLADPFVKKASRLSHLTNSMSNSER